MPILITQKIFNSKFKIIHYIADYLKTSKYLKHRLNKINKLNIYYFI